MRAGINAVTAALVVGVLIGLALTPDGRGWLRRPTLMLGGAANASASPPPTTVSPAALPAAPAAPAPVLTPLATRAASGHLRIGVFGDSMADGLWTGLYREMRDQPGVTVTKFSEVSTGLSRYDYVDIQAKTARQIAEQPVDVAVILFGTNDAQGISIDGEIHDFGTDGWKAAYAKRVDDLVAMLRSQNVAVYWVGLPTMKRASFDARMTLINQVVSARMQALGVPWLETESITRNDEGEYDAYLPETGTGRRRLMRANDGIHMSMAGYLRITEPVAARLKRDAGLTGPVAEPAA
ncbi:SGNH/GDSL hydrolase family protein [Brevundimonas sp.]|uniref:SGNH/GDSL hydrolase family protein n=1 Tax=Brevundimonas sp. TaxID=1871086 RepID=UPI003D10CFA3